MPYYKKSKYIDETINSILNQSMQEFEIIIIDDELTESSLKVLTNLKKLDSRVKVFRNNKNLGAGQSRNNAINLCIGEYVAFCDCDDLWKPQKLEKQIQFMREFNLRFSFTSYEIINNQIFLVKFKCLL